RVVSPFSLFPTRHPPPKLSPLSLHDALPIYARPHQFVPHGIGGDDRLVLMGHAAGIETESDPPAERRAERRRSDASSAVALNRRSEEHTSELQSRGHLVCRLLLEKKKKRHRR